ncbi:FAD-dependent oxidoreductase [Pseudoalteromonas shioyasakiensis]|uniref:FAD-dependent oxidoreductase n=1 Tax=Pseudoalteromonas shioyasakiensis TaxID=1190813 RepID=UPI002117F3E1|nr:FAD-dependent oxidoreductase [Pseudoalteromonas shioyasakiensis]MCQ8878777.1 FAD-dependent oxidoreductase [Pseudoalteromonas shioyasakiensis]
MSGKQRVVVVGNGMVGHHFVEQLTQLKQHGDELEITVLSGEDRLAYDRVHLSEFFSGKTASDLALTTADIYGDWHVNFFTNAKVENIDRQQQFVTTQQGNRFYYDKLILATGSFPFVPPIPGKDRDHCLVYRTINDLEAIKRSASQSKVGVVIGGGLLGLEAANALKKLGLQTHVVEFAPQLMGVQVDQAGGRLLKKKIEQLGVNVHTSMATEQIVEGHQCRYKMCFKGGHELETDMILFSAGIRPYDNLGREFGLDIGERGGIVINNHCQTSDRNIYAIGECALWSNFIFGLVAPGYTMAKVAAKHIIFNNEVDAFTGADMSTKLKLMGVEVGSIGDAHARATGAKSYIFDDQINGIYKKIVVNQSGDRLLGAVLVGDTSDYDSLLQRYLNNLALVEPAESLIMPLAGSLAEIDPVDLPDDAIICVCNKVTKLTIQNSILSGCTDLAKVKSSTKACTGCGSCEQMVKSIIDSNNMLVTITEPEQLSAPAV